MKTSIPNRRRVQLTLARETVRILGAKQLGQVHAGLRAVDTCDMGPNSCKPPME